MERQKPGTELIVLTSAVCVSEASSVSSRLIVVDKRLKTPQSATLSHCSFNTLSTLGCQKWSPVNQSWPDTEFDLAHQRFALFFYFMWGKMHFKWAYLRLLMIHFFIVEWATCAWSQSMDCIYMQHSGWWAQCRLTFCCCAPGCES